MMRGDMEQSFTERGTIKSMEHQNTKDIYLLLVRTRSLFSRIIHIATKDEYTHISIGMESDCTEFYSFARRYTKLPLPAGFVHESIEKGLMAKSKKAPCELYRMAVSSDTYELLYDKFRKMMPRSKQYRYNVLGTFLCFFGIALKRKNKYFCSQFVAETLEELGVMNLTKSPELYRPVDIKNTLELQLCYKGTLGGLEKERFCLTC